MPNFIEIEETFCGQMDVCTYVRTTDGRTDRHLRPALLGRLCRRVDLIIIMIIIIIIRIVVTVVVVVVTICVIILLGVLVYDHW